MIKGIIVFSILFLTGFIDKELQAQCDVVVAFRYIDYYNRSCSGLLFQSGISLNGFAQGSCSDLIFSPDLTGQPTSTSYQTGPLHALVVYPNPVVDKFYIQWKDLPLDCIVQLHSPIGVQLKVYHRKAGEALTEMDTRELGSGIYMLTISNHQYQYQYSQTLLKF